MTRRTGGILAALLIAAVVVAGVLSAFASSSPDGLTSVSEDKGFSSLEQPHAAEDSPLAGYETRGIADDRLSGGVAGLLGVMVTFGLGAGLFFLVRGRSRRDDQVSAGTTSPNAG